MTETIVLGKGLLRSADAPLEWNAGVVIEHGAIVELGANEALIQRHPASDVLDARGLILCPGFVNAHLHAYGVLAHGIPIRDVPNGFDGFLNGFWWPRVEDRLDHRMIGAAFELACIESIRSGVTTFCDVLEAPRVADGSLSVEAEIAERAGIRVILCVEASERHGAAMGERALEENIRFAKIVSSHPLIDGMQCIHTSFTCSEGFVRRAKESADLTGCGIHLHLSESGYEPAQALRRYGVRPTQWYDGIGFLDGSVLASQVVDVDAEEIDCLARRGVRVVHMPLSNCEVGGGIAPVPAMIERGLQPGLGSDGYLNDPFDVMRGAFLLHKANCRNSNVMPSRTVWAMATSWGAAAVGHPELGVLAPGHPADLIGIDPETDTPLTADNVLDQFLLYRRGAHVRLSMVAGRTLLLGDELITMDEERARQRVRQEAERLWGTADD